MKKKMGFFSDDMALSNALNSSVMIAVFTSGRAKGGATPIKIRKDGI